MNTSIEFQNHLRFGRGILEHRYRYYRLDEPVLEDSMYDLLERDYLANVAVHGDPVGLADMVDFPDSPECLAAAERVNSRTDCWGAWFKEMLPVWDRLGPPKYYRFLYLRERQK
jgi:hypothetical protein